jgi:hypothetical protein
MLIPAALLEQKGSETPASVSDLNFKGASSPRWRVALELALRRYSGVVFGVLSWKAKPYAQ